MRFNYDRPATNWMQEGLPIGNGHMGAMLWGDVHSERLQFNEESLWVGDENDTGAYQNFGDILVRFDSKWGVSNPSHNSSPPDKTVAASCDGDPATKWCIENGGKFPILWQMDLPTPMLVASYAITSAEDVPDAIPPPGGFSDRKMANPGRYSTKGRAFPSGRNATWRIILICQHDVLFAFPLRVPASAWRPALSSR